MHAVPRPFRRPCIVRTKKGSRPGPGSPTVSLYVVGKIVGHSNATMTERYGHLVKGRNQEVVEKLSDWENGNLHVLVVPCKEGGNAVHSFPVGDSTNSMVGILPFQVAEGG
jgi:hypothetical protein